MAIVRGGIIVNDTENSGIGVLGLLGVLFVGLKLTDYIDWSWWWVTAPFWGPVAVLLVPFGVIAFLIAVLVAVEIAKDIAKKQGKSKT